MSSFLTNLFFKTPSNVLAWENLQEVFVMLVVIVLHSKLFDDFVMLFFIHCFSTSSLALPWAIARSSQSDSRHIQFNLSGPFCYSFTASATDLRERFSLSRVFYLTLLPDLWHNLLLSRVPWEPTVLPWRLQGHPLMFETQIWPICLFESHSVQQKVLVGRFYLKITTGRLMKNLLLTSKKSFRNKWACLKPHALSNRPQSYTACGKLKH